MTAASEHPGTVQSKFALNYGFAAEGDKCIDCQLEFGTYTSFVSVGRLGEPGRLCDGCAQDTPAGDMAEAIDHIDTVVRLAGGPDEIGAMAVNVMRAVNFLLDEVWMPQVVAAMETGGAS